MFNSNLLSIKDFTFLSKSLFIDIKEFEILFNKLGKNGIIDTYIYQIENEKIVSCQVHLKDNYTIIEFKEYFSEHNINDYTIEFINWGYFYGYIKL